jgi:hypothetical protein
MVRTNSPRASRTVTCSPRWIPSSKDVNDVTSAGVEETEMSAPLYLGSLAPFHAKGLKIAESIESASK